MFLAQSDNASDGLKAMPWYADANTSPRCTGQVGLRSNPGEGALPLF
jgi:hypothetical protein